MEMAANKTDKDLDYKNLELQLQAIWKLKKNPAVYLLIVIISLCGSWLVSTFLGFDLMARPVDVAGIVIFTIISLIIGCMLFMFLTSIFYLIETALRQRMLEMEISSTQNEAKEDIFENSIKMSYKYLDQYYLQTRDHAQRGFLVTMCVSIFGAVLIGIGIMAMFLGDVTPSYITCASGVITEFIAAIFFYLYNKTISSMRNYHNKLVLSQNISIALKVAESLPEAEKICAKNTIINELLKDINAHLVKEDTFAEEAKN